ncbi:hypothetical protein Bca4012_077550 [Brassica carinata]|uniref:Micro-fibrillar-associated protein 1 C-terminal domain-containing protein n=2 Tax=Brassica oleracea TaxID=3712 RepID=A0A0D3D829_BRAOL|nr:PREDICTED: microfibrillar-associated protein 1-like [Brassica oleracea var. oleracea]XP_013696269.2 microfibrillar-associated protein 1A [Brassica napus]VDD37369.1 unnamed protein product [Brassica oleracea]
MSVTAGVRDVALATRAKLQGGIGQTRVGRYWPGKAPEWAKEDHDDDDDDHVGKHKKKKVDVLDDELERNKNDDPRLRRLGQVRADHRRVREAAEVVSTEEEELRNQEKEEEDVDALEERRSRIREKNLKRTREEADLMPPLEDEDEEEVQEEEESEYETDSEYEMFGIYMMKPVFVPKAVRETIAERERMEAEEEALEELAKKKLEMRKIETKAIVVAEVRKEEERRKNVQLEEEADLGDVETDDETNEAEEYEAWKTRELGKIKREKEARGAMLREKEEVDKLRNMTEEERKECGRDNNPKPSSSEKPKNKWKFMQRYYHKGAYFQEQGSDETDDIYQRDYSAPTGVDKLDKSVLREVMQVKKFGRSGGTKWTHLVKEDTTYGGKNKKDETKDWSDPWVSNVFLRQKYNKRMTAMDAPIARPKGSKRMKAW